MIYAYFDAIVWYIALTGLKCEQRTNKSKHKNPEISSIKTPIIIIVVIKVNRSDGKTFKIIHNTQQNIAHCGKKVFFIFYFHYQLSNWLNPAAHILLKLMMFTWWMGNVLQIISLFFLYEFHGRKKFSSHIYHTHAQTCLLIFELFLYHWIPAFVYIQSISCWR